MSTPTFDWRNAPDGWASGDPLPPDATPLDEQNLEASDAAVLDAANAYTDARVASVGGVGGAGVTVTGPTLPALPSGTEYVWNKTNGVGVLLDIVSGVAS